MTLKSAIRPFVPPALYEAAHRAKMLLFAPTAVEPEPTRFDGPHSKQWWKTRDEGDINSIEGFWSTRNNRARSIIGEEIAALEGSSLLEIGCHAGPNLWAAATRKHFDKIAGTDLSPRVLDFAKRALVDNLGRDVSLHEADASRLPFDDDEFDITLLSVVLCCIGPEDILQDLDEALRVTRRWLVLAEPFDDDPAHGTPAGLPDYYPNTTYWIRNYTTLFGKRASLASVRHLASQDQMGHIRSVMVFEKL